MQAIESRLQHIPGLHIEANYKGGVSVRDRLACGHAVAKRILGARHWPAVERKRHKEAGKPAKAAYSP
jgi:hypothetical protein